MNRDFKMKNKEIQHLVEHLRSLPRETEWVEFKHNNADPQEIGEYISALSNAAALNRKNHAYILWGVEDGTHNLIGTTFRPRQKKKGNEELENWLLHLLTPRIDIHIHEVSINDLPIVLFDIQPASHQPVAFGEANTSGWAVTRKISKIIRRKREPCGRCSPRSPLKAGSH